MTTATPQTPATPATPAAVAVPATPATPAAPAVPAAPAAAAAPAKVEIADLKGMLEAAGVDKDQVAKAMAPYFPEKLDEKLRGATDRETIDKLVEALGGVPKAPANVDGYKLDLTAEQKQRFGDLDKDPAWGVVREAALKAGVPAATLQSFFIETYGSLVAKGLMPKPLDLASEAAKLAPAGERDGQAVMRAAAQRVVAIANDIVATGQQAGLTDQATNRLLGWVYQSADNAIAMEKLLGQIRRGSGVASGGPAGTGKADDPMAFLRAMYPTNYKN